MADKREAGGGAILWIAVLASFVAFLDSSVVNVALPAISRDLGGGLAVQQWIVDAYLLTLGAFILLAGSLSDLFSRERVLLAGLLGFGIASLLCALAPSGGFLIGARALQGVAGALLVPSSLALLNSRFYGPARSTAIGRWTGWTSSAMLAGPLLGGVLVDAASWRWIFAINVVPVTVTIVLLVREMRQRGSARVAAGADASTRPPVMRAGVDVIGAFLAALGLGGVTFGLIEQGRAGWASAEVVTALAVGVAASTAFVLVERRRRNPMLPFSIFRAHDFAVGNAATAFIYAALSFGPLMVGLYLQQRAGLSAVEAGLGLTPSTVIAILLSGRFGKLAGRLGARWFMGSGPLIMAAGFLLMLAIATPLHYWWQLLPGIVLFGLGVSVTVAPLTSAILGSVPQEQSGIASAVNNAVARIAGLIAIACAGLIVGETLDHAGLQRALVLTAVLLVVGGVVSALGIRDDAWQRGRRDAARSAAE